MYGPVNWEDNYQHDSYLPPPPDMNLPPMEDPGISDVNAIRSKDVYDYPVFFDIGQNEYITGTERKTLKDENARSKWDFFYRYSSNAMDQLKSKRFRYLDSEYQKRERVRQGKIREQQGNIKKYKNLKDSMKKNRIVVIIISSLISIISLGVALYIMEVCCFFIPGISGIFLIILIRIYFL